MRSLTFTTLLAVIPLSNGAYLGRVGKERRKNDPGYMHITTKNFHIGGVKGKRSQYADPLHMLLQHGHVFPENMRLPKEGEGAGDAVDVDSSLLFIRSKTAEFLYKFGGIQQNTSGGLLGADLLARLGKPSYQGGPGTRRAIYVKDARLPGGYGYDYGAKECRGGGIGGQVVANQRAKKFYYENFLYNAHELHRQGDMNFLHYGAGKKDENGNPVPILHPGPEENTNTYSTHKNAKKFYQNDTAALTQEEIEAEAAVHRTFHEKAIAMLKKQGPIESLAEKFAKKMGITSQAADQLVQHAEKYKDLLHGAAGVEAVREARKFRLEWGVDGRRHRLRDAEQARTSAGLFLPLVPGHLPRPGDEKVYKDHYAKLFVHMHRQKGKNQTDTEVVDEAVDEAVDKLFHRALRALPLDHADLDATTLMKGARVAMPSHVSFGVRCVPRLPHQEVAPRARTFLPVPTRKGKGQGALRVGKGTVPVFAKGKIENGLPNSNQAGKMRLDRSNVLRSLALMPMMPLTAHAADFKNFKPVQPIQFIAALGDPTASSGSGAKDWGIWRVDPGPRGVKLQDYKKLEDSKGVARAGWKFDKDDWWLEEHGLIMEKPDFPMPAGRYAVTGGRSTTTILNVKDDGSWDLQDGKLFDVTHLPCRAARYKGGSPANAEPADFPVKPGAVMPAVSGSDKQDYAVLFIIGKEA